MLQRLCNSRVSLFCRGFVPPLECKKGADRRTGGGTGGGVYVLPLKVPFS